MVNLLETLYALTALAFIAALVQLIRRRPTSARNYALAGVIGTIGSALLYRALS